MARSFLMQHLLRAYRSLRGAARAGMPVDEYVELQALQRALSRRRFLELSAGAGEAAAPAARGEPPPLGMGEGG